MAETAKELVFALFDQGRRPSDPEVKALGIKSKTTTTTISGGKSLTLRKRVLLLLSLVVLLLLSLVVLLLERQARLPRQSLLVR